jgi:hypothetical protein
MNWEVGMTRVGHGTVFSRLFDSSILIKAFCWLLSTNKLMFQSPHKTKKRPLSNTLFTVSSSNSRKLSTLLFGGLYIQITMILNSTSSIAEISKTFSLPSQKGKLFGF